MKKTTLIALTPVLLIACSTWALQPTKELSKPLTAQPTPATTPTTMKSDTVTATPRPDEWWTKKHQELCDKAKAAAAKGDVPLLFVGDSITEGWLGEGKGVWEKRYASINAVNLGIGGDRTQHVLYRMQHGALDELAKLKNPPKLAVVMIGTNNSNGNDNTAEEIAAGIVADVKAIRDKLPHTKVLLLAIFPRGEKPNPQREKNAKASEIAFKTADGKNVVTLDIGAKFLQADGTLTKEIMPDFLHLTPKGYEIWADAIEAAIKDATADHQPANPAERKPEHKPAEKPAEPAKH